MSIFIKWANDVDETLYATIDVGQHSLPYVYAVLRCGHSDEEHYHDNAEGRTLIASYKNRRPSRTLLTERNERMHC